MNNSTNAQIAINYSDFGPIQVWTDGKGNILPPFFWVPMYANTDTMPENGKMINVEVYNSETDTYESLYAKFVYDHDCFGGASVHQDGENLGEAQSWEYAENQNGMPDAYYVDGPCYFKR